jgi:CBS-domain-containing membrane protein
MQLSQVGERPQVGDVKVSEIMSRPVIYVTPETTIKEAARLLVGHGISALPVLDRTGGLVGIVSEADLIEIEARPDPRSQSTPLPATAGSMPEIVSDVMTRKVHTVSLQAEVSQAARMMLDTEVKRVPVMKGRHVVGILSRRDLVKVIARQDEEVEGEISRRLVEAGMPASSASVEVASGVATIGLDDRRASRRLAESIALTVPGVLEVRFNP